jgi:hypothetical protein
VNDGNHSTTGGAAQQRFEALRAVLGGSAVPYGYTLTVLSSHSILSHSHGAPTTVEILLFVIGAIAAFTLLALLSQRTSARALPASRGDLIRAGTMQVFAIGAAFGATVLIGLIPGIAAWPLGAFAATSLYLVIASLEIDVARRLDED